MFVAATEANIKFLNSTRHQDPGEFLLWAIMEESEEEARTMMELTGARKFEHLFTVSIDECKWCPLNHWSYELESHPILQMPLVDPNTNNFRNVSNLIDTYIYN